MFKAPLLIIALSITSVTFSQKKFRKVENGRIDCANYYLGNAEDTSLMTLFDSFEASNLVTWKDYKLFLFETKRTKGKYYFDLFSPALPREILDKGLSTNKVDKEPVTGISYLAAVEYCKWKTVYDSKYVFEHSYRLPSLEEWMVLDRDLKKKLDINGGIAEWTSSAKNESSYSLKDSEFDSYEYRVKEWDHPVMKRKLVMGGSFRLDSEKPINYSKIDHYQDSTYTHVGFRVIKEKTDDFDPAWSDWLCDYVDKFDPWIFGTETTIKTHDGGNIVYYDNQGTACGMYTAYFPNGNPRSSGFLYNNMRLGTWTVYDQSGEKLQERVYTGLNSFRITYPKLKGDVEASLRDSMQFFHSRDVNGLLDYPFVKEGYIDNSYRIISLLEKSNNPEIFSKKNLISILEDAFLSGDIKCYDTTIWFREELSEVEFKKRMEGEIVRFEIASDFFYDLERNCAENRILGIAPVVMDSSSKEETIVGWFYYPQIRTTLRKEYIVPSPRKHLNIAEYLKFDELMVPTNFDDLFMKGDYNAKVKEVHNWKKELIISNNNSLLFFLLKTEHDWWKETAGH